MTNQWLRLWHDMPTDPKWRTISRTSKQPITAVIAVYIHMLVSASNATERGRTQSWCDEDVASALDLDTDQVVAIREAMQGRVLEGDYLTGWESRQPKREDGASERSKAWREKNKRERDEAERKRTQTNANERQDTDTEKDTDTERKSEVVAATTRAKANRASRLQSDWDLPEKWGEWAESQGLSPEEIIREADKFKDYWQGNGKTKMDWEATWRNWIRRCMEVKR